MDRSSNGALSAEELEELNKELFERCGTFENTDYNLNQVKELIRRGANVNWIQKKYRVVASLLSVNDPSCLHHASYSGHLSIVMELLSNGADITIEDSGGFTALLCARMCDRHDITDLLLSKGAVLSNNDKKVLLMQACEKGDLNSVRQYLNQDADVNWIYQFDYDFKIRNPSHLHVASYHGHLSVVMELLNNGADIMVEDKNGLTGLFYARIKGHHEVADVLISKGVVLSKNDKNALLYEACRNGDLDTVREYLSQDVVDVNWTYKEHTDYEGKFHSRGQSCLHTALSHGHFPVVKELLLNDKIDIDVKDDAGKTVLMHVSENGLNDSVVTLINEGADVNAQDKDGTTALMFACEKGHQDLADTLIAKGADIHAKGKYYTVLTYACLSGNNDLVVSLINKGVNVNDRPEGCWTALMCGREHQDVVDTLIRNGADINAKKEDGGTVLTMASLDGLNDLVVTLINKGADVNDKIKDGETALMNACVNGRQDVINTLIHNKADINAKNEEGRTCLMHACTYGHYNVIDTLLSNGADINAKDENHHTVIDLLEEQSKTDSFHDSNKKCLQLLKSHISGNKPSVRHDDEVGKSQQQRDKEKQHQKETDNDDTALDYDDPYFLKAISEGSGHLKPAVVVMHGPPGAGKTSVKQLLLGRPPLLPEEQNSTDLFERPIRTYRIKTYGQDKLREVNKEEFLQMLVNEVVSEEKKKAVAIDTKTNDHSFQKPLAHHDKVKPVEQFVGPSLASEATNRPSSYVNLNPVVPTPKPLLNRFSKVMRNRKLSTRDLFKLDSIYLVDSGGQPQFADIIPILFQSEETLYILVIRLDQDLDTRHNNCYCINGERYQLPETLELTNRQMIERACQIAESSKKRVIIIGTHLDKVDSLAERIRQFNDDLQAALLQKYSSVIVPSSHGSIIFPVNAMSVGSEREEYTRELQDCLISIMSSTKEIEVPLKWFVYELELDEKSLETHGVLDKATCIEVGKDLEMDKAEVESSLKFFNRIAIHLYHPDINDLVLIKMDPLTDRLSALIKTSFIPPKFCPVNMPNQLKQFGLFSKEYLQMAFSGFNDNKCLSDDNFLQITKHLKVIVHIDDELYFAPSALSVNSKDDLGKTMNYEPCLLNWEDHILPPAFFFVFIVVLLQQVDDHSKSCFDVPRAESKIYQSRDKITLISKLYGGRVIFINKQKWICIQYITGCTKLESRYIKVLRVVLKALSSVIQKFSKISSISFPSITFLCPLCIEDGQYHPCSLDGDSECCICSVTYELCPLTEEMSQIMQVMKNFQEGSSESHNRTDAITGPYKKTSHSEKHLPLSSGITRRSTATTELRENEESIDDQQSLCSTPKSPFNIFKNHFAEICDLVSNPSKLANDLFEANLISEPTLDDICTNSSLNRYDKVNQCLHEIRRAMKSRSNVEIIKSLCAVLRKQRNESLDEVVHAIMIELGQVVPSSHSGKKW